MLHNPKPLFDAIRTLHGKLIQQDVDLINKALALAEQDSPAELVPDVPAGRYDVSPRGVTAIKTCEGCKLRAYPDPGSRDGKPWTIGWGSTGPGIVKGTVWTQEQADARFLADLRRFEMLVEAALGDAPTSQQQFDALVSFAYNVGIVAFRNSTLLRLHKAGDFDGAAEQFMRWVYNDGHKMAGLEKRRNHECTIYAEGIYA